MFAKKKNKEPVSDDEFDVEEFVKMMLESANETSDSKYSVVMTRIAAIGIGAGIGVIVSVCNNKNSTKKRVQELEKRVSELEHKIS